MAGDDVDGLGPSRCRDGNYGLSVADLRNINEQKGPEAVDLIQNKYGGTLEVCKLLYTSPNEGKINIQIIVIHSPQNTPYHICGMKKSLGLSVCLDCCSTNNLLIPE